MIQHALWITALLLLTDCKIAAANPTTPVDPAARFSGERAMADLVKQVDGGPRIPGSPGITYTRSLITETLEAHGFKAGRHDFKVQSPLLGHEVDGQNLYGVRAPEGKVKYIVSAHYDTRPFADQDRDPARRREPVPGANDGASGVAVLLELARALSSSGTTVGVALVFFDIEDHGMSGDASGFCLGSREFAKALPQQLKDFEVGINLDMVGDKDLVLPMEGYSLSKAPKLTFDLWRYGKILHPQTWMEQRGPSVYDDHLSFTGTNRPYIDVIDFTYPYWHTTDDTADKCSAQSLDIVGDTVLGFILHSRRAE